MKKLNFSQMEQIQGGSALGCLSAALSFVAACGVSFSIVAAIVVVSSGILVYDQCF